MKALMTLIAWIVFLITLFFYARVVQAGGTGSMVVIKKLQAMQIPTTFVLHITWYDMINTNFGYIGYDEVDHATNIAGPWIFETNVVRGMTNSWTETSTNPNNFVMIHPHL